jgi:hypothetical protein
MAKVETLHSLLPLRSQIAARLLMLLRQSSDPEWEMNQAWTRLAEADLMQANPPLPLQPASFVRVAIADNPDLQSRLETMERMFDPQASETVGDLISNLLPGEMT